MNIIYKTISTNKCICNRFCSIWNIRQMSMQKTDRNSNVKSQHFDVIIVGGGPVGLAMASSICKHLFVGKFQISIELNFT